MSKLKEFGKFFKDHPMGTLGVVFEMMALTMIVEAVYDGGGSVGGYLSAATAFFLGGGVSIGAQVIGGSAREACDEKPPYEAIP